MATSRRRPQLLRVGCRRRWWCVLVVGQLVVQGRRSALPYGRGRYRGTARPERGRGAQAIEWAKRPRGKRTAADRRGAAARSGSRHGNGCEDPSTRRKPRHSGLRATGQTLGEPFLRADPHEDQCTRLRACGRVDAQCSAVHPHVARRPRSHPHGHRRRPRRIDGACIDPIPRRGVWQAPALTPRASPHPSRSPALPPPSARSPTASPPRRR
jgi:hypothetical protein